MSKKKTEAVDGVQVTIHIEKMKIGDLKILDRAGKGDLPTEELLAFLDRIVEEDVEELPITALPQITQALSDAVGDASNPVTSEGN